LTLPALPPGARVSRFACRQSRFFAVFCFFHAFETLSFRCKTLKLRRERLPLAFFCVIPHPSRASARRASKSAYAEFLPRANTPIGELCTAVSYSLPRSPLWSLPVILAVSSFRNSHFYCFLFFFNVGAMFFCICMFLSGQFFFIPCFPFSLY